MYRYKDLHFRFSADACTSTFVTANIFPWYLLIRENFANEAVPLIVASPKITKYALDKRLQILFFVELSVLLPRQATEPESSQYSSTVAHRCLEPPAVLD